MTNNNLIAGTVGITGTGTVNNNLTITGAVNNAATFNNNAPAAQVSGLLTNTAGITTDNGALNGGANVSGGTLTGTGSIAGNASITGGTFAPGSGAPSSSMAITGNLAFSSGALYLVQVNPSTSALASVTGTATLGGATVNAIFANGSYVSKQYTILTAAGGVNGTFNSLVNSNLPSGFSSSLSYGLNNAFLDLTLNFTPPSSPSFGSGLTANQQNVGNALTNFFNATGGIPMVYGTLTPAGLTQASGEIATGTQQATFDAMSLFMGVMTDPFVAGRGNPIGDSSGAASQFASNGSVSSGYLPRSGAERDAYAAVYGKVPSADPFVQRWRVWTAGYGGSRDHQRNATAWDPNTCNFWRLWRRCGCRYTGSPHLRLRACACWRRYCAISKCG